MHEDIIKLFCDNKNPKQAKKMAAYMKDNFPFLGIQKPDRSNLQKDFIKQVKQEKNIDWDFVFLLWGLPEREFQYFAIDYLIALKNYIEESDIEKVEKLIIEKSWWDSVDILSSNIIGILCAKYSKLVKSNILNWAESENIWLVRTAILFQLKYKEKTNVELLNHIINKNSNSKEFFITKAIGWALRQYSKTDPEWVRLFIAGNRLQPLSVREGSKYL